MNKKVILILVTVLALVAGLVGPMTPATVSAWDPESYYSPTTVDGDISEWDLINDFFANMYRAGNNTKPHESTAYLRYDCVPNTLYVLVLTEGTIPALASGWESAAWAAIGSVSNKVYTGASVNDGIPPDFAWVGLSADGLTAQGYEASFQLDPGIWEIMIHIEVSHDGAQTSATTGFPKILLPFEITCLGEHPLAIHVNKYVSLDNQATWIESTIAPGPTVVEGTELYFKFVVHNSVNIPLYNVTLTDSVYGDLSTEPGFLDELAPEGEPGSSFEVIIGPITADTLGLHTNRATTSGYNAEGTPTSDSEEQDLYYTVIAREVEPLAASITLQKYVSVDDLTYITESPWPVVTLGEPVWFKFVVTNTGDVELEGITLEDSLYDLTNIDPELPSTFGVGESYYGVIGPIYEEVGTYNNTATTTGDYDGDPYSDTDDASFTVNQADTVTVTLLNPLDTIVVGETVQDTITISTATGGIFPDISGTWQLEASQDVTFASGVVAVQDGAVSGQPPFEVTADAWAPPNAGTWYFRATYSGDPNYIVSMSIPSDETLVVQKAPTSTVTLLDPLGPIIVGQNVQDQITISTSATGTLPAVDGTWTLEASQDIAFGTGVITVQTGSVSGSLPFTITTDAWAPPIVGTWYFRATYSGDDNYFDSQSNPVDETLIVKYWAFTPGFWKNNTTGKGKASHNAWAYTAYDTDQTLQDIFGTTAPCLLTMKPERAKGNKVFADYKLIEALSFKGGSTVEGKMEILLRELVASLLNASFHEEMLTPDGVYPYSSTQVIVDLAPVLCSGDPIQIIELYTELNTINNGIHYINWNWTVGGTHPLP
ncbi:hypothetical protein ACFLXA_03980 [Chloroflexota bacterium]